MGFYLILTLIFTIVEIILLISRAVEWDDDYRLNPRPFKSIFKVYDLIQIVFFAGLPFIIGGICIGYLIHCVVSPEMHQNSFLNKPLFKIK